MTDAPAAAPDTAPRRIRCPRCNGAMTALALSSHRPVPVPVDHCGTCRLVWFDALESVQLDALGWVRLLRTMEAGLAQPLAAAQVPRPACPVCSSVFKVVRNRTRYGRFAVQECPLGHGHLSSHAALLAERGLVRPLGLPERQALAKERHPLHCLNCGGPATADDEHCSWCGTVLAVIDLPRLAHSLQVRDAAMGPSPTQRGRHTTWPCRGCGAALDPGRDAECPSCGHLVVAQRLPDIAPLLDEAEAVLAAHAETATRVRERFPSGRRAPVTDGPAPVSTLREVEPWGWAGWLPLGVLALLAVLSLGWLSGVGRASPRAVLTVPVGAAPGALWPWVAEHARQAPHDLHDQQRLRLGVLELHLRQLAGGRWRPERPLSDLLQRAPDPLSMKLDWQSALGRWLQMQPASAADTLPAVAIGSGERWVADAPGVWVDAPARSIGFWAPRVRNTAPVALPVAALHVRMPASNGASLAWHCEPATAIAALATGAEVQLLCRTPRAPTWDPGAWSDAMQALRSGAFVPEWQAGEGRRSLSFEDFDALALGLVTQASRQGGGTAVPLSARWTGLTGGGLVGTVAALAALGFVLFCGLAHRFGERRAMGALLLAAAPALVLLSRGEGAATPLLVGAGLAACAMLVFGYRFAYRVYRDVVALKLGRG